MKTHKNFYSQIYDMKNLIRAWKKARKRKTKKEYVKDFEENLAYNLKILHDELKYQTYSHKSLKTFILRDPKTRKISKAEFRDRVVHHAIINILEPIFDPIFIYDSCANRKNKGNLFAIKRFEKFKRKVSRNGSVVKNRFSDSNYVCGYCLKADIKHYFQEVNHEVLLEIIKRKIKDKKVLWLIKKILGAGDMKRERDAGKIYFCIDNDSKKGMPLGNLTSQFFANVYLNELDQFIKHKLKCEHFIRYVDDFVILHSSRSQLEKLKLSVNKFLKENLKLELHPEKSRIIPLSKGINFLGFRNFYYFKLLRKRNIKNMERKIKLFNEHKIDYEKFIESFQGWEAYAKWSNSNNLTNKLIRKINPNN